MDEKPRIIDKRQSDTGIQYLLSVTDEWVTSSTSRFLNPELVELYEWLHSSGFREGVDNLPTVIRPKVAVPKGTRKRTQSSSSHLSRPSPSPQKPKDRQQRHTLTLKDDDDDDDDDQQQQEPQQQQQQEPDEFEVDLELARESKKQRLEGSYIEDLGHLTLTSPNSSREATVTQPVTPLSPQSSPISPAGQSSSSIPLASLTLESKKTSPQENSPSSTNPPQLVEFNRNTEQMIEVYFKEGMDASGVEMFDILLGPYRRPTKEFVAAFFFAVVLSPLIDPATIEAAIHVLDRALTLHGPQIFASVWNVRKRSQELSDGSSVFSRQQTSINSSNPGSSGGSSLGGGERGGLSSSSSQKDGPLGMERAVANRLPRWNDVWDLIKAEFELDTKPESKQHIALQEYHIRLRLLGGDDRPQEPPSPTSPFAMGKSLQREEKIIREELGRAIVGLLLRVLEQDAVLNNVGARSFFCRDVLEFDPLSRSKATRQSLDAAFEVVGLAMSSKYLSPPPPLHKTTATSRKQVSPWPLNSRCQLSAAGMETLQLGQQIILLTIRFTQAGILFQENGLEELARETLSRLSKVNKDRRIPGSASGSSKQAPSAFVLERYSLDQTEIFLKTLLQGPCLLSSGTGSGAGLKCAMKEGRLEATSDMADESFASSSASLFDFGGGGGQEGAGFMSQTGVCMGSSAFVMILVDLWFRSKTSAKSGSGGGLMLNFKMVVDLYSSPPMVRPAAAKFSKTSSKQSSSSASSLDDDDELEKWNAKDMEQLEWTVMMMEVLIWAWIQARGIRRHEIEGTGVEEALSRKDMSAFQSSSSQRNTTSGWLAMSDLLSSIGGSLQRRWEQLEDVIEVAITVEELCLR